jgi:hypothetical protein
MANLPEATFAIQDNLSWNCDEAMVFIRYRQIQIVQ